MGLDTSHDAWHGSYSSFAAFRQRIAQVAGFPELEQMFGFGGDLRWEDLTTGDKRLVPLLNHSDCDGEIGPEDCAKIADALEELLPKLARESDRWLRRNVKAFAAGCRLAAAANEPLDFH